MVGDRFCLLAHAAGFIDPLYSKGLYLTHVSVILAADLILKAHQTGDYGSAAFAPLEDMTLRYIEMNDRLVANSFKSWANYKLWSVYSILWLLGAYLEYLKLNVARLYAKSRADYLGELQGLKMVGGGFAPFFELQEKIDALLEQVKPDNELAVDRAAAEIRSLYASFPWMPSAFRDLLNGKNHLPSNKLRVNLFNRTDGFLGGGSYRAHFFHENLSMRSLLLKAVGEQARYSVPAMKRQRRRDLRISRHRRLHP